jgi:hypothetical protein
MKHRREVHGVHVNSETALAAEFHRTWASSLPVLHLSMALNVEIARSSHALNDNDVMLVLLHDPRWLHNTLVLAEKLLPQLHEKIPAFIPDQAIRLIPIESQPAINP